jgi:hypothetical protein
MNKLDVAISLIQLLNDRKQIDTKLIANELNVSMRTAQRYLLDLSKMPCVVFNEKTHSYSLDSKFNLKDVLVDKNNGNGLNNIHNTLNESLCLICLNERGAIAEMYPQCKINISYNDKFAIDELVSIIKMKLDCRACSLP